MKKLMLAMMLAVCALVMVGCNKGKSADEKKTPEQIKQEVAKMDAKDIQATIENYKKAIADKTTKMESKAEELTKIPPAELLTGSDKAKGLQGEIGALKDSIAKLEKNMAAYAEGLKKDAAQK